MRSFRSVRSCAIRFLTARQARETFRLHKVEFCWLLATLAMLGFAAPGFSQGTPPDEPGPPITIVVGGFILTQGTSIDWAANPNAELGLLGDLDTADAATVVVLPLDHSTMTVSDWLWLGIDPVDAATTIATLQPDQRLSAILNLEGQVQSVVVTTTSETSPPSNVVVVSAPPNSPPMTIEEWLELLLRLLEEYTRHHGPQDNPNGAW